jgi:DNA-binding winged helix-turn-helix (wHTH) protein
LADTKAYLDYQLETWLFRCQQQQLESAEQLTQLTPAQSAILLALIEHYPNTVTSEQLLTDIGMGLTRNKLYQGIARLRRIFNDTVHKANFIDTVPKLGYCLRVKPQLINQQVHADQDSDGQEKLGQQPDNGKDSDIEPEVSHSNILDDLSFINHKAAPTHDVTIAANLLFTEQVETTVTPESQMSQPEHAQLHDEVQICLDPELTTNNEPVATKDRRYGMVATLALIIALVIAGAVWLMPNEPKVVDRADLDLVSFSEVTFEVSQDVPATLQQDTVELVSRNIGWWLRQKLQHLPLIKVVESSSEIKFPRLDTHLSFANEAVAISQTFYRDQHSSGLQLPIQLLSHSGSIASQLVDIELIKLFGPSSQLALASDLCTFEHFSTDIVSQAKGETEKLTGASSCLLENKQLLTRLNLQFEQDSSRSNRQQLQQLITAIKAKYPNHSLGYRAAAHLALLVDDKALAIAQYQRVIELNSTVADYLALSRLYRAQQHFKLSFRLINAALVFSPNNRELIYLQARDLQQLGYNLRASFISNKKLDFSNDVLEQLRFSHVTSDRVTEFLQKDSTVNEPQLARIVATSFVKDGLPLDQPAQALAQIDPLLIESATEKWRYVILLVANSRESQALEFIEQHHMALQGADDLTLLGDQVFYLGHYARILQLTEQDKAARVILEAIIKFFTNEPSGQQLLSTHLAQAYALLGDSSKATNELARIISKGWLPDIRYEMANLVTNPNFASLATNWQFLALVELVEKRQLLLREIVDNNYKQSVRVNNED